ncbi:MAG: protein arginine kinase [Bacillota bacterium]
MAYWFNTSGEQDDIVISSRVRLARNFELLPFPSMMDTNHAEEIIQTVRTALECAGGAYTFFPMNDLSETDKLELVEQHLISPALSTKPDSAMLLSFDKRLSVMLNEEDHVRIQCILPGLQLHEAEALVMELERTLQSSTMFAFDEKLGYLTACPTNIGTGMRASVMMHLPALTATGYIASLLKTVGEFGLAVRGLYGEGSHAVANIYQLSNQVTLGLSESEITDKILTSAQQIIQDEREARMLYMSSDGRIELEDKLLRSYGIATHARRMTAGEFMSLLSDIKLALSLGLIDGISHVTLHSLLIAAQPASLQKRAGRELSLFDRDVLRAEIVREALRPQK